MYVGYAERCSIRDVLHSCRMYRTIFWKFSAEYSACDFLEKRLKKGEKTAYNFLQLFYNFCPESDETGGQFMEFKKFEKTHKNAKFQAKRAVMKQDETVKTQIPTMKPLDSDKKVEKAISVPAAAPVQEKIDFSNVKIEPIFKDMVDFDTFSKSDFRAVKILACEAVKKSKKLLKFTLNDGERTDRVILSGIHEYYEPEELVGKTAIAIVNLPPRKMMGIDSEGMLISAVHEEDGHEGLNLLMVDDRIPAGAKLY